MTEFPTLHILQCRLSLLLTYDQRQNDQFDTLMIE